MTHQTPSVTAHHFPKKGERFINGRWVKPKPVETAADRVDYLRRMAGWPPLKRKGM